MGNLQTAIASLVVKAKKYGDRRLGEQNTKASLIEPLLETLGWDIRDPDEVHREYRPTGRDSPVDYALKVLRKPRLFLEAKGLGESLDERKWIAQVLGYAAVAGVEWCVLSNGDEYRFYNAMAPLDAADKMFCQVRLTACNGEEAERVLSLISRDSLDQETLEALWISYFVDRRVKAALQDMLSTPSKSIVKLVQRHAPKLTPRQIADSIRRLEIKIESAASVPAISRRNPERAKRSGASTSSGQAKKSRTSSNVTLADLVGAGLLKTPLRLFRHYKGRDLEATLLPDGEVQFQSTRYNSCSTAAELARGSITGRRMNTNGWTFWQYESADGKTRLLDAARQEFSEQVPRGGQGQPELRLSGAAVARRRA